MPYITQVVKGYVTWDGRVVDGYVRHIRTDAAVIPDVATRINAVPTAPDYTTDMRGRDKKKFATEWPDNVVEMELPASLTGREGWTVQRVMGRESLTKFGNLQHHCGGSHHVNIGKGVWSFITFMGPDNVPHATIHTKQIEYLMGQKPNSQYDYYRDRDLRVNPYNQPPYNQPPYQEKYGHLAAGWDYNRAHQGFIGSRYDQSSYSGQVPGYDEAILVSGVPSVIVSADNYDKHYGLFSKASDKYEPFLKFWYEAMKAEGVSAYVQPKAARS